MSTIHYFHTPFGLSTYIVNGENLTSLSLTFNLFDPLTKKGLDYREANSRLKAFGDILCGVFLVTKISPDKDSGEDKYNYLIILENINSSNLSTNKLVKITSHLSSEVCMFFENECNLERDAVEYRSRFTQWIASNIVDVIESKD